MTLEQLVPTLDLCQQLKAAGFSQDAAFVWTSRCGEPPEILSKGYAEDEWENGGGFMTLCTAPTAGELEEWLRQQVGNPLEETTIIVSHDGSKEVAYGAGVRSARGKYTIAYGDTDIAALAALVLELTKSHE